jgi:hypothetical protein
MKKEERQWLDREFEPLKKRIAQRAQLKKARSALGSPDARVGPVAKSSMAATSQPEGVAVSINLSLPKAKLPKLPYKRIGLASAAMVLVVGVFIFASSRYTAYQKHREEAKALQSASPDIAFKPLVPADKAKQTGQSLGYNYDAEKQLLGFTDKYEGASLTISQQPLPDAFKTDSNSLNKAAQSINAKEVVDTGKGIVYISTNKNGVEQIIVFNTKDLLVFVRSDKKLSKDQWGTYVDQLKLSK